MSDKPPVQAIPQHKLERFARLREAFVKKYGAQPLFYARAPGRVNLIGEHIDYCGYAVLPMALEQDIVIAACPSDDGKIHIANYDHQYGDHTFSTSIEELDIDKSRPQWFHYFACGYRGIVENVGIENPSGMKLLVHGTIPRSSGLSSSSAFVCASALVTMYINKKHISKLEIADICVRCEMYIGTQGGGMDQSISFLAEPGTAKLIEFNPIRATDITLPEGAVFVISNSCMEMNKAATSEFNTRVVECRLAAQVISKAKGLPWRELKRLGDVQQRLGLPLKDMELVVTELLHTEPYTKEEICSILNVTSEELDGLSLSQNTLHVQSFKLFDRAYHVYTEAARVHRFKEICEQKPPNSRELLGQLMSASHQSCSKVYECSCKDLDNLVDVCCQAGALGSRLTGAGWGGCAVSMVPSDKLDDFLNTVRSRFYVLEPHRKASVNESLFATQPGGGATIYTE